MSAAKEVTFLRKVVEGIAYRIIMHAPLLDKAPNVSMLIPPPTAPEPKWVPKRMGFDLGEDHPPREKK